MKNAFIICEYNPFHNGHRYMINLLKEEYGFDSVICIMSGNYVQRGEPAVLDKYTRAKESLAGGADLILELPVTFATSSAREFASAGVALADKLCIGGSLAFGVEPGITEEDLLELPASDSQAVKENLRKGMTYPEAVSESYGIQVSGPNAILASEYMRALKKTSLMSLIIERKGDSYSSDMHKGNGFASAKAVRSLLSHGDFSQASSLTGSSEEVFSAFPLTFPDMLSPVLSEKLLLLDDYSAYLDVSREINDRLLNRKNLIMSFSERIDDTKTRQYTRSRISRALLHIALGITKEKADDLKDHGYIKYVRILGYRKDSGLLNEIKKSTSLPIYARSAAFAEDHPEEIYYDQLYYSLTSQKSEFLRSPVII